MHVSRILYSRNASESANHAYMTQYEALAADWLRSLRGKRSQRALSRRLGYRSNIVYRWESGRCFPTARVVLSAIDKLGQDVRSAMERFYGGIPSWLSTTQPASRDGVVRLLEDLRGETSMVALAAKTGFSRHRIARWLSGAAEPKLPEWLALIDASSLRLLDFVAAFVDPLTLPSARSEWRRLQAARDSAYAHPESHVVLRVLELAEYAKRKRHDDEFVARRAGITLHELAACLKLLQTAGQVRWQDEKWLPVEERLVDTRQDEVRARGLKVFWLRRAADHVDGGGDGTFGYNLFSVSKRDLAKIRQLHLRYYREVQEIVAASKPNDHVALFATQLFRLDHEG
jgi:transcriptional regulator with XRE-family HTH domain